jgi:hypothetical protein
LCSVKKATLFATRNNIRCSSLKVRVERRPKVLEHTSKVLRKIFALKRDWRSLHKELYAKSSSSVGRDSSVGIVTRYGIDGPGIEFRWG